MSHARPEGNQDNLVMPFKEPGETVNDIMKSNSMKKLDELTLVKTKEQLTFIVNGNI